MERSAVQTWAAGILAYARATGSQTAWSAFLAMLDNLVGTPAFRRTAFQAGYSRHELFRLLCHLCEGIISQEETNMLRLLTAHGRLRSIGLIRRRYEELRDKEAGVVHVMLITATPIEAATWESLMPSLMQRFGTGVRPHFHHDPDLMGGIIIRTGDQVLDVSVRSRLSRLAMSLKQ